MNISDEMNRTLNAQVSMEAAASQYYLTTASWCEISGYDGGAAYFYAQSDEERMHMLKIIRFLNGLGVPASIPAVAKPDISHNSLEEAIKTSLENERRVTVAIRNALTLAYQKTDYATLDILHWFANEQVQEETKFEALLQKFDVIGRDPLAVAEIDKMLASQAGTG